jgi:hypothetical protein
MDLSDLLQRILNDVWVWIGFRWYNIELIGGILSNLGFLKG